jgi:hypothetical protein
MLFFERITRDDRHEIVSMIILDILQDFSQRGMGDKSPLK